MLNSRQGHFSAAPWGSSLQIHPEGRSFSRSYGAILPNSLTKVLPIPLVFSTRLPVSVCGTGARVSLEAFLDSLGSTTCGPYGHRRHPSASGGGLSCRLQLPRGLAPERPFSGWPTLLCHPFAQTTRRGSGLLTGCPSPTPLGLGLGPTNPTRINLPSETLDIRRTWFSHVFRYSCRHSHLCRPQAVLSVSTVFFSPTQRSPTTLPLSSRIRSFGG